MKNLSVEQQLATSHTDMYMYVHTKNLGMPLSLIRTELSLIRIGLSPIRTELSPIRTRLSSAAAERVFSMLENSFYTIT